jgi:hypothetical protein
MGPAHLLITPSAQNSYSRESCDRQAAMSRPEQRLIGSVRRECLDHIIMLGESHLRRTLKEYAAYYNGVRTHLAWTKDAPIFRPVVSMVSVGALPVLGGLHHHCVRI